MIVLDLAHDLRGAGDDQRVVGGSAQIREFLLSCAAGESRRRRRHRGGPGGGLRDAGQLLLQLRRDLVGIGVVQVAALRCRRPSRSGVSRWAISALDAQPRGRFAADQHAVGALVGDQFQRLQPPSCCACSLVERVHDAHDFRGRGILQRARPPRPASPTWSMRAMIRMIRFTLVA